VRGESFSKQPWLTFFLASNIHPPRDRLFGVHPMRGMILGNAKILDIDNDRVIVYSCGIMLQVVEDLNAGIWSITDNNVWWGYQVQKNTLCGCWREGMMSLRKPQS
jgi:hypothetical protein